MPELSVVVPVYNERDNIPPLLAEIAAALRGRVDYEVVYVDDASSDDSLDVLKAERAQQPPTANAEQNFLHDARRAVAAVNTQRQIAETLGVRR